MIVLRSFFSSRSRRMYVLGIYTALLLAVLSATFAFAFALFSRSHVGLSDRIAEIGDVLVGGTLLLAVIAGLVALQAYAAATGLPDLKLQVWFEYSQKNRPVFRASIAENGWVEAVLPTSQTFATISIRNRSDYSAKNPTVVVRLVAMKFDRSKNEEVWPVIESDNIGATAVQWDGGPLYSIHGDSVRRLPLLDLNRLRYLPEFGQPSLIFELLADGGYRREICIAVEFVNDTSSTKLLAVADTAVEKSVDWI